jgi:TatD DNase family protein
VDAHLHLADPSYSGRIEEAIADANVNHVESLLSNAVDYETSVQTIALAKQHPSKVLAAIGVHPSTATRATNYRLEEFSQLIDENASYVSAIGEIGLDGKYTNDEKALERQREVFRFFLNLAETKGLPAVHSRLAVDEVLGTLPDFHIPKVLLHWYDGPVSNLRIIKQRGYAISIGPAAAYSEAIREIARNADLDMILTETDAPVRYRGPFEGRTTQPSFVVDVVRKLSEINGVDAQAVRESVWHNFEEFMSHQSPP